MMSRRFTDQLTLSDNTSLCLAMKLVSVIVNVGVESLCFTVGCIMRIRRTSALRRIYLAGCAANHRVRR